MKYYTGDKILNKNKPFNFVIGNRSAGKSFFWKRYCINMWLKKKEKYVYVRRYQADLDMVCPTLFDDMKIKFPDNEIRVEGDKIYIDNVVAGYAIPVSKFTKYKSVSMEDVTTILFDEFLPEDGRYLGGREKPMLEPELCLNFYQTVGRGYKKPIRENLRFIFIANAVTKNNPYFRYFKIDRELCDDAKFISRTGYTVQIVNQETVTNAIQKTEFGKLISGTRYGEYALTNDYILDETAFIESKPKGTHYPLYIVVCDGVEYLFIQYPDLGIWYITEQLGNTDTSYLPRYSIKLSDHTANYVNLDMLGVRLKRLRGLYALGAVRFSSIQAKRFFENELL